MASFVHFLQLSSVQLLSCVRLFATSWIAVSQASLSITSSWSLPKLMSIELVMPSTIPAVLGLNLKIILSKGQLFPAL